jgi:hypothetical protein
MTWGELVELYRLTDDQRALSWRSFEGEAVESCTIIVTRANEL